MKRRLLRLGMLLLCMVLLPVFPAFAEDCFTVDVDTLDMDRLTSSDYISAHLTSSAQGIRVRKWIGDAAYVRLTLTQMNTRTLLFDKEYGFVGGDFDSGTIYLPYGGDGTAPYLITLYVGESGYGLPFMHTQRRLTSSSACTSGVRLRDLDSSLGGDWMMGTMLHLDTLRQTGRMNIDLCANGSYLIGTAYVTLSGESLCVDVSFNASANAELREHSVYVITDCQSFHSAPAFSLGQWVDVSGASSALLYLPMQLSFDPAGLPAFYYDRSSVQRQIDLWNENCASRTSSPASDWNAAPSWDHSGWDDGGWSNDGWSDPDYGWSDDWHSDASGWQGRALPCTRQGFALDPLPLRGGCIA